MRYQIEFSEFALQITSLEDDLIVDTAYHLISSIGDELKVAEAKSFIKEFSKSSFLHANDYTCFFRTTNFVLIPNTIFDDNERVNYYELAFGHPNDSNQLFTCQNVRLGVTSIYEIVPWVSKFCAAFFPSNPITATHTTYLNQGKSIENNDLEGSIFFDESSFYLQLFQRGKLIYSQETAINSTDDIIYFTTAALLKLPIDNFQGEIKIYPRKQDDTAAQITTLFERIKELSDLKFSSFNYDTYQIQILCE